MTDDRADNRADNQMTEAASLRAADALFNSSSEGILICDAFNRIIKVNQAFCIITGYGAKEALGKDPGFLSSERHDQAFFKTMWDEITRRGVWEGEIWNRRKNGEVHPEWMTITAIKKPDGAVESYAAIFSDISRRRRNETQNDYQANYDSLTGLPNQRLLQDRLQMAVEQAAAERRQMAVLHIDMDKFKDINDRLGFAAGDALLVEMGIRIKASLRDGDDAGRLGRDNFLAIMPLIRSADEASMVIRRIQEAIRKPLLLQGQQSDTLLTASIGAALYPGDGESAGELMRNANTAAFHAKQQGSNQSRFFSADMNARAIERLSVETMLRRSLAEDGFRLLYQPKVDLRRGVISGVEALARWARPDLSGQGFNDLAEPQSFIPLAEETGLIIPLGEWVIKTACAQAKEWHDAGISLPVAVNLSARQLDDAGLFDFIKSTLLETKLDPGLLELEITETAIMEDAKKAAQILSKLHGMGVRLAIDDFGSGYSSLVYLRSFPLDAIKIDGSFVAHIGDGGRCLASAVIGIGHSLDLKVIAEGVENERQLTFLRRQQCDEIQGNIFSRPVAAKEILDLLAKPLAP